ncbi:hypothetical protein NMY22_g1620 [Coprinellus aureogranulatus]|nr:hypothetical protein NMY22_g1620 [Coprinellus aureogranulatus]
MEAEHAATLLSELESSQRATNDAICQSSPDSGQLDINLSEVLIKSPPVAATSPSEDSTVANKQRVAQLEKSERQLKQIIREYEQALQQVSFMARDPNLYAPVKAEIAKVAQYIQSLERQANLFRDWWLSDHFLLLAALDHIPKDDLPLFEHIVTSSQARYGAFRASQPSP